MANLLDQLKTMTTVVSDSGDINSIKAYKPTDSTTNPSLIAAAAGMSEYQSIVDDVLKKTRTTRTSPLPRSKRWPWPLAARFSRSFPVVFRRKSTPA